jgi:hypothetical protein
MPVIDRTGKGFFAGFATLFPTAAFPQAAFPKLAAWPKLDTGTRPFNIAADPHAYWRDAMQRGQLYWDNLRRRCNEVADTAERTAERLARIEAIFAVPSKQAGPGARGKAPAKPAAEAPQETV